MLVTFAGWLDAFQAYAVGSQQPSMTPPVLERGRRFFLVNGADDFVGAKVESPAVAFNQGVRLIEHMAQARFFE